MNTQGKDVRILFYRLWALEYVYRNDSFVRERNRIFEIENNLAEEIEAISSDIDEIDKSRGVNTISLEEAMLDEGYKEYLAKFPWHSQPSSFFSSGRMCFFALNESEYFLRLHPDKQESILDAFKLADLVKCKFGFCFDSRPARCSRYLFENITNIEGIIFPEESKGVQVGHIIKGIPILGDDPIEVTAIYSNGSRLSVEERPGEVVLGLNFYEPIESVLNWISNIYEDWHKQNNRDRSGGINAEYLRATCVGESVPESQAPRAAGLWLWDRVKELGGDEGAKTQAIDEMHEQFDIDALGLGKKQYPEFYYYLRRTEACIEAAKVLSFDKKKTQANKRKRSIGTKKRKQVPGTPTAK